MRLTGHRRNSNDSVNSSVGCSDSGVSTGAEMRRIQRKRGAVLREKGAALR